MLLALASVTAGCGQKTDQSAGTTTSDSLLSTNPIEQPQGGIEPQSGVQPEQTPPAATPAPTPAPAKKPAPSPKPAAPSTTVPGGTAIKVGVDVALNTETANVGDPWSGTSRTPSPSARPRRSRPAASCTASSRP